MLVNHSIAHASLALMFAIPPTQQGIEENALGSTNFLTDRQVTAMQLSTRMGEQLRQYAPIGEIADLVVDGKTGEITFLVIEEEIPLQGVNPQRIIPWDKLIWRDEPEGDGRIVEILMTEEDFLGLPSFVAAESELLASAEDKVQGDTAAPISHSGGQKKEKEKPHPMYLASALTDLDVFPDGGDAPLSAIESAVFDLDEGRLAFFTMDVAGGNYLVPMEAVSVREGEKSKKATGEKQLVAFVPFKESELGDGPTLDDEDRRNARNPKFRDDSIRFFSQWMKKNESEKDQSSKDGDQQPGKEDKKDDSEGAKGDQSF